MRWHPLVPASDPPPENNYFKLALAVADNNNGEGEWHTLKIEDTALGFYKKDAVGNYAMT